MSNATISRNMKRIQQSCGSCEYCDTKQPKDQKSCMICFLRRGPDGNHKTVNQFNTCDRYSKKAK